MHTLGESSTDLLTTGGAAELLGRSVQHVRDLAKAGELPSVFIPDTYQGRYYFNRSDVEEFKAQRGGDAR